MEIDDKIALIHDFAGEYLGVKDVQLQIFFEINNLGVPFSIGVVNEYISLNNSAYSIIEETWKELCDLLDIDPNDEYENLEDMLYQSNFDY